MGLPALKERFESFAAETQTRTQDVTRTATVLSFSVGKVVRIANSMTEAFARLRTSFLTGAAELRNGFDKLEGYKEAPEDAMEDCAALLASMKRFRRTMSRPYFENDGKSSITAADDLENMKTATSGDGRTVRRVARRIREAAETCEHQRLRFVATMDEMIDRLEAYVGQWFDEEAFRAAYVIALGRESIKRFPLVNAYLAR